MEIKNFTQFANLLGTKQVVHMNPAFDKLFMCMMSYGSMCSCGGNSNQDKSNKHAECNRIYREALGSIDSIKPYLFNGCQDNTISFYVDDVYLIKTIGR
jgi:hypothetical protein